MTCPSRLLKSLPWFWRAGRSTKRHETMETTQINEEKEKIAQPTLFKVRDLRQKTQFKIDDAYLNGYARVCGQNATLVYISLCRHAEFNTQKAFPSQQRIAYQHRMSRGSVAQGIKKLLEYGIIHITQDRREGKFTNYIYTLLDKSSWKPKPLDSQPCIQSDTRSNRVLPDRTVPENTKENKNVKGEQNFKQKNIFTEQVLSPALSKEKDWKNFGLLMEKFKLVNPSYGRLFANTTQRGCLERLIKTHGEEKIRRILDLLPRTNIQQFAPVITTPIELENKLGQLMAFVQKEKNKGPKFITL